MATCACPRASLVCTARARARRPDNVLLEWQLALALHAAGDFAVVGRRANGKTRLIRTITTKARPGEELTRHNLPELGKLGLIIQPRMRRSYFSYIFAGY